MPNSLKDIEEDDNCWLFFFFTMGLIAAMIFFGEKLYKFMETRSFIKAGYTQEVRRVNRHDEIIWVKPNQSSEAEVEN